VVMIEKDSSIDSKSNDSDEDIFNGSNRNNKQMNKDKRSKKEKKCSFRDTIAAAGASICKIFDCSKSHEEN
jgi:hypothetical protein